MYRERDYTGKVLSVCALFLCLSLCLYLCLRLYPRLCLCLCVCLCLCAYVCVPLFVCLCLPASISLKCVHAVLLPPLSLVCPCVCCPLYRWVRDLERSLCALWDTFVFEEPAPEASVGAGEGVHGRPRMRHHISLTH